MQFLIYQKEKPKCKCNKPQLYNKKEFEKRKTKIYYQINTNEYYCLDTVYIVNIAFIAYQIGTVIFLKLI